MKAWFEHMSQDPSAHSGVQCIQEGYPGGTATNDELCRDCGKPFSHHHKWNRSCVSC